MTQHFLEPKPVPQTYAADYNEPLYLVELQNADQLEGGTRSALEAEFRTALDQTYGSHTAAAAAVHAHWDSDEEGQGLDAGGPGYFSEVVAGLAPRFAQRLPAGAYFDCTPDFEALARPMA